MSTAKPMFRFSRDLKKAVHSGEGYDDYMTVYQFLQEKIGILQYRINRMQKHIDDFYDEGGVITHDGNVYTVELGESKITVLYDESGSVTGYSVEGLKGRREFVWYMLGLFFSTHLMPIYQKIIDSTQEQLKDVDNDNILKGISEIRDLIRGDRYLTAAAVSNLKIASEDDVDPFSMFSGGDDL